MKKKKLFFAIVEDFGNYEALVIRREKDILKVDEGYLAGYNSAKKSDSSAYQYSAGGLAYSSVVADDPGTLIKILSSLQDEPGLPKLFFETIDECKTNLANYKLEKPNENTVDSAYLAATVMKTISNLPQFVHSSIPEAFKVAKSVANDPFVQLPALVYIDSVLRSLPPDGTLDVKELSSGELMLNGVAVQNYGLKTRVSEFAFCAEPDIFNASLTQTREFMSSGLYPANDWVLENIASGPDID